MKKIAIYGKGGIGKSTVASNLAAAWGEKGKRVLQIGCDPKADSTLSLRGGQPLPTVLDTMRAKKDAFELSEVVKPGLHGIFCAEAGGPVPGVGCAGRGIITALEMLEKKKLMETCRPDVVLYDVLGDVVCGGFSMPMRTGYADEVYIVTSGENMSIYAAANIALALQNFKGRNYASLGGIIYNQRNQRGDIERVKELCQEFGTEIVGCIPESEEIFEAENQKKVLLEAFPDCKAAESFRTLAERILC